MSSVASTLEQRVEISHAREFGRVAVMLGGDSSEREFVSTWSIAKAGFKKGRSDF